MNFLTFDIESCTGNPLDGSLCSFGYILSKEGVTVDSGDILCNPLPERFTLGSFGKAASLKLAYPPAHFRRQPRFNARYREIKALFDSADMVLGFAVQNDLKYVNNACDKFSLPRIGFKFLDVQLLAGFILPELKGHGLKAFADHFNITFIEHRSDEDARVTFEVFTRVLELSGMSLEGLMQRFGIVCGVNGQEGHVNCYAEAIIDERLQAGSRSTLKLLTHYYANNAARFVEKRGDRLAGKGVSISEGLYVKDKLSARRIACTVAAEGGTYDSSIISCNVFVVGEGDKLGGRVKKLNPNCRIMSMAEFSDLCGGLVDFEFDDKQILREHYTALVSDREENKI